MRGGFERSDTLGFSYPTETPMSCLCSDADAHDVFVCVLQRVVRSRRKNAAGLARHVAPGAHSCRGSGRLSLLLLWPQIASDWNKPDGQMCIGGDRAEVLRFLHDLPVRKVGGTALTVIGVMGIEVSGDRAVSTRELCTTVVGVLKPSLLPVLCPQQRVEGLLVVSV